jgi:hypothetical protein
VNDYLAISELVTEPFSQPPTKSDLVRLRSLFVALGSVLRSWNIERPAGRPVPPTVESVGLLGMSLALDIASAWMEAVASVPDPLSEPSQDGASTGNPEMEETMRMETLPAPVSPSRAS